jgi:hypothetical protein
MSVMSVVVGCPALELERFRAAQRFNDVPRQAARSLRGEGTLSGFAAKGVGSIVA